MVSATARAVPTTISFTGRLKTTSGVVNGNVDLTLKLFDTATGGSAVWTETHTGVVADEGLVYVDLGSTTTLDSTVLNGTKVFLEVTVGAETLSPRLPMNSVPYAVRSGDADNAATLGGTIGASQVITGVNGTGAIAANKAGNTVTISLVTTGCTSGQVYKYNGTTFACANEVAYTAGNGIAISGGNVVSLLTTGCTANQVLKFNGSTWSCQNEATTSFTGTAPITVTGTAISLAACAANQIYKYNGTAWVCAADSDTTYTSGSGLTLTGTTFATDNAVVARKDAAAGNQSFDGGTLFLDYTNNRVGVNSSTPGQALDVNGNTRSGDFLYAIPRTAVLFINGASFAHHPGLPGTWTKSQLAGTISGGGNQQFLDYPVDLPNGSTITNLSCFTEDNESVDVNGTASINTWTYGDINRVSTLVSLNLATTGASTNTNTASTNTNVLFDNTNAGAYLFVLYSWTGTPTGNNAFYGCKITYTMPRAGK